MKELQLHNIKCILGDSKTKQMKSESEEEMGAR